MRSYLVMGFFALFVMIVSLVRCLGDQEFFRLTAMKRVWGRKRGLTMHFLANVALPMVLGIVFLSRGVVAPGYPPEDPTRLTAPVSTALLQPAEPGLTDQPAVELYAEVDSSQAPAYPEINPYAHWFRLP